MLYAIIEYFILFIYYTKEMIIICWYKILTHNLYIIKIIKPKPPHTHLISLNTQPQVLYSSLTSQIYPLYSLFPFHLHLHQISAKPKQFQSKFQPKPKPCLFLTKKSKPSAIHSQPIQTDIQLYYIYAKKQSIFQ